MTQDFSALLAEIKNKDIKYVNFRFSDTHGKWQHMTFDVAKVNPDFLNNGIAFDGSSIQGWQPINDSDLILRPDPNAFMLDPFAAMATMIVICDVYFPVEGTTYDRDPRSVAKRANAYLQASGIGDKAFFGPEPEFFIFDNVTFETKYNSSGYHVDNIELPSNSGVKYEEGNYGHRPAEKGGYIPVPPVDSGYDIRSEMLATMRDMGLSVEKHHHEVAPGQHELGFGFDELVATGDNVQIYKYCVQMVAHSYGKTATFLPKPIYGDNGSGMHIHHSIWKNGKNMFAGDKEALLSQEALWYIGGIFKHARAINAFSNPSTNSYKRLVPGYEAPVLLAFSAQNRSAACRIPYAGSPKGRRIELRFPDALANPYLAMSAMMMAGIDGVKNKIDPGKMSDEDLFHSTSDEVKKIPVIAKSLRRAVESLDKDRGFLKEAGVFTDEMIDAYIALKIEEIISVETHPHPLEFSLYYSR